MQLYWYLLAWLLAGRIAVACESTKWTVRYNHREQSEGFRSSLRINKAPLRFSLRTMLIATAIVAGVIGAGGVGGAMSELLQPVEDTADSSRVGTELLQVTS
jgi:hypothetical protein